MTDKIKSCPFCGGEVEKDWGIPSLYWVRCIECGAEGGQYPSLKEAIEAWNTRKPMDRIAEQLKEVSFVETVEEYAEINLLLLDDAIEIVKAGGKDE